MALLDEVGGRAAILAIFAVVAFGACSVVNSADDPLPVGATGGSGTTTSGSGGTTTTTSGSGGTTTTTSESGGTTTTTSGSGGTTSSTTGSGGTGAEGGAVCGDGVTDGDEDCDDGDTVPGDGCDASCGVEGSCSEPVTIVLSDSGQGTLTGTIAAANVGGPDQVAGAACDGAQAGSGWDRIYRVDLTAPRDLLLELSGDFDMVLRLLSAPCNTTSAVPEPGADACSNVGAVGGAESLIVPDLPAGTYYVVVDGADSDAEGEFTLDVTARCPASALKLTQLDIGANDGLHLVNTSSSCAVDLDGLDVLFDDSSGVDRSLALPSQWLQPGATLRVAKSPPPGHVSSGTFDFSASRGGAAMLCFGPCSASRGGRVIDLVAFSEGQAHPTLPTGVSFAPAGLNGITNEATYSYLREATAGDYLAFLASDWDVGFRDGFEDADASDLVVQSGSYTRQVTGAQSALGQYSYTMTGGNGAHSDGSTIQRAFGQPSYISFRVRFDTTTNARGYFVFRDASDSNGIIFFYCNSSTMTLGTAGTLGSCVGNTWYHVEFRNLDWSARTYDAYVGGALALADAPFRGASTQGDRIDLYHFTGPSQAWWDEIVVKP